MCTGSEKEKEINRVNEIGVDCKNPGALIIRWSSDFTVPLSSSDFTVEWLGFFRVLRRVQLMNVPQ